MRYVVAFLWIITYRNCQYFRSIRFFFAVRGLRLGVLNARFQHTLSPPPPFIQFIPFILCVRHCKSEYNWALYLLILSMVWNVTMMWLVVMVCLVLVVFSDICYGSPHLGPVGMVTIGCLFFVRVQNLLYTNIYIGCRVIHCSGHISSVKHSIFACLMNLMTLYGFVLNGATRVLSPRVSRLVCMRLSHLVRMRYVDSSKFLQYLHTAVLLSI